MTCLIDGSLLQDIIKLTGQLLTQYIKRDEFSGGLGGLVVSALDFQAGYCGLNSLVGWVAYWLAHSTFKRDIVGSNPARVETIFRPLVHLAHTGRALG